MNMPGHTTESRKIRKHTVQIPMTEVCAELGLPEDAHLLRADQGTHMKVNGQMVETPNLMLVFTSPA